MAPKYRQIVDSLRSRILQGEFSADEKLPPERSLMREYKVSYATITRAMNDLKQTGLVRREWGRGTFVCQTRQSSRDIAITFNQGYEVSHPFFSALLRGMARGLEELNAPMQLYSIAGQRVLLTDQGNRQLQQALQEGRIGALVMCSPHEPDDLSEITKLGVSVVSVGNEYPGLLLPTVCEDVASGARITADYLAKLGLRRMGMIVGPPHHYSARLVRGSELFRQAMLDAFQLRGQSCPTDAIIHSDGLMRWDSVAEAVQALLQSPQRPEAIICRDQMIASQTITLAKAMGIAVPRDLSIIAWADVIHGTSITTIAVPLEDMGYLAVRKAYEHMTTGAGEKVVLPVKLIKRTSCAAADRAAAKH